MFTVFIILSSNRIFLAVQDQPNSQDFNRDGSSAQQGKLFQICFKECHCTFCVMWGLIEDMIFLEVCKKV